MMDAKKIKLLLCVSLFCGTPLKLAAENLFPAGAANKSVGMPAANTVQGPTAVFYNPAALKLDAQHNTQFELGYIQAQQQYEHPDFDPVKVKVNSPLATLSYGYQWSQRVNLGFSFFPARRGEITIDGLPRFVSSQITALEITTTETRYDTGLGGNMQIIDNLFLGASLVHQHEERKIVGKTPGTDSELLNVDAKGDFFRPVYGIQYIYQQILVGLSYTPSREKSYEGSQTLASSGGEKSSPRFRRYDPAVIGFGVNYYYNDWIYSLHANQKFMSRGEQRIDEGLAMSTTKADVRDVLEWGFGVSHRVNRQMKLNLNYSKLPSPWGNGSRTDDSVVVGTDFGVADAVDRDIYSIGLDYRISDNLSFENAFYLAQGRRETPIEAANPGFFEIETALLSTSVNYSF